VRGVTPFRVRSVHSFIGTLGKTPVTGFTDGKVLKFAGREKVIVKGLDTDELVSTPDCVPPIAVTAFWMLMPVFGGVSADSVYVGDVKLVAGAPVTGEAGLKDMEDYSFGQGFSRKRIYSLC
jgi:hypothetical protein